MTVPKNGKPRGKKPGGAKRLRLLKVIAQPVFVLDDGENVHEVVSEPINVAAADWSTWSQNAFSPEEMGKLAGQVIAQQAAQNGQPIPVPPSDPALKAVE